MSCAHGCSKVGRVLYIQCAEDEDNGEAEENWPQRLNELKAHKCWNDIQNDDYGHINYAVTAYAVANGHRNCLRTLHLNCNAGWHANLAIVAAQNN